MPQNTYGHGLGPAAAYTKTYTSSQPLSPVTDTWGPHVIFFFLLSSSSLAERVDGDGEKQQQHAAEQQQKHAAERSSRLGRRAEDAADVLLLLARMTVLHDVGGGSPARPLHAVRVLRAPPTSRRPCPRRAAQAMSSVCRQWRAAAAARRATAATAVDGEQQQQHFGRAAAAAARRASSATNTSHTSLPGRAVALCSARGEEERTRGAI